MSYKYKIKKVYVAIDRSIWALTPKRAADFLFDGAFMVEMPDPDDYGQELKRFPRNLHRYEVGGEPQQSYNEYPLWKPLDWPAFEYAGTFEYLFPDDPRVGDLPVFDEDDLPEFDDD